jgi:hypothetical protein
LLKKLQVYSLKFPASTWPTATFDGHQRKEFHESSGFFSSGKNGHVKNSERSSSREIDKTTRAPD